MSEQTHGAGSRRALDHVAISDASAKRIRLVARVALWTEVLVFFILLASRGLPRSPDVRNWEQFAQLLLLGMIVIGVLLAWRFEGLGGAIIVGAGLGIGVLASLEFHPLLAILAALAFVVPGILLMLAWQRTQTIRSIVLLVTSLVAVMAVAGFASFAVYDWAIGPTHPESSTPAPEPDVVEWIWSGGVTSTMATVKAGLISEAPVELVLSRNEALTDGITVPAEVTDGIASFAIDGLEPGTDYWYAPQAGGRTVDAWKGHFATFVDGPASFTVAAASCARAASTGSVYDAIREAQPDLFIVTGDWFYADIAADLPDAYASAFRATLTSPPQSALYRALPIAYVWDDHDYSYNDSDSTTPARPAAMAAYREFVPHYPLAGPETPIYQSFTIGRVRFLLTDARSARSPKGEVDGPGKTMLGDEQIDWLLGELADAEGTAALVVWVNPVPWLDVATAGADHWAGYAFEREQLAEAVAGFDVPLLMVSGDAHMIAIDDGTNTDYSGTGRGFPLFQAASLDRPASVKGGPYSEGVIGGSGQFGLIHVEDDGNTLTVTLEGRNWTGRTLLSYTFEPGGA